ncbi:MAG: 50S ribosomal protein L11 [bacterium]
MARKLKTVIKLQIPAAKALAGPPVGPALGQHGVNIQDFCVKFNEATKDRAGDVVPVEISVYDDRTFDFVLKVSPASELVRKAAGVAKGAKKVGEEKVGKITKAQLEEIAKKKIQDLNANDIEAAMKILAGTARSMGVEVVE